MYLNIVIFTTRRVESQAHRRKYHERLRAKKMHTCIRTFEEVDKKALANYDDDTLVDVGCERTKPKDRFWYEVKREEVK